MSEPKEEVAPDRLRALLEAKAKALHDQALHSDGAVPGEQLEALQRLSGLVAICDASQPVRSRSHWPLIGLFATTLFIVSILLFIRRQRTEIELDLQVDQVSFSLASRQVLSEQLSLSALGVSGLSRIQLPRGHDTEAATLVSGRDFNSSVELAVAADHTPRGEVSLPELILPAQTRVSLEATGIPSQSRWTLQGAGLDLQANVNGPVQINLTGASERQLSFLSPKAISFEPQAQQVDLDLTFLTLPQKLSPLPLAIQDLSLLRIDDRRGPDGLPVRRVSTILSGTIYFEELDGREYKIRPGEAIQLEGAKGEIESLELKDGHIILQFRGRVKNIRTGPAEIGRSLMPTWLEWLKARRGLALFWGTALYLFGLAVGALRWLKAPQ